MDIALGAVFNCSWRRKKQLGKAYFCLYPHCLLSSERFRDPWLVGLLKCCSWRQNLNESHCVDRCHGCPQLGRCWRRKVRGETGIDSNTRNGNPNNLILNLISFRKVSKATLKAVCGLAFFYLQNCKLFQILTWDWNPYFSACGWSPRAAW